MGSLRGSFIRNMTCLGFHPQAQTSTSIFTLHGTHQSVSALKAKMCSQINNSHPKQCQWYEVTCRNWQMFN